METARAAAPASAIIWTYSYLRFRRNAIETLIRGTDTLSWEALPKNDPDTGYLTMAGFIPAIKTIIRRILIAVMLYLYAYIIACVLISNKRLLLFNAWFPFDTSVSPAYELITIEQSIACSAYVFIVFPFPGFYATLVCIACSQLEKLRASLLSIKQSHDVSRQDVSAETDLEEEGQIFTSQEVFRHMQKQLDDCIRFHQQILRYARELEDALSPFMSGIFLLSLVTLCLCAFSVVTSWGDYSMMLQGAIAYSMGLVPLVFYCWFGNELTAQAERVKYAAFGCDWIGAPIPFQKCIRLIISATNKEITLTAGKFVPVTISTMVNMIQQSVSYFMFLLQVKESVERDESNNI